MIKRVLIANRGEIASRIIRACHDIGIETVAVYSEADEGMPYIKASDLSLCIGKPAARETYRNANVLLSAAKATGADAIHPGYGFLSEDSNFAEACVQNGFIFIGPPAAAIARMGDKIAAKDFARALGVPLVPGGEIDEAQMKSKLSSLHYPILLKAAAGGGGRGMRVVSSAAAFAPAFNQARLEASEAFGDGTIYWERLITNARHIEVQVLSDAHGNHIHLGERDCTLQRRHQKLLEESPSPILNENTRAELLDAAVNISSHLDYSGAGTIEFLYDADAGSFHFIEMNTRIQVEHPVTEQITGVDLVREQIRIASGEAISASTLAATRQGCSIECRINAEDPDANFMPSPGVLSVFAPPGGPGVRVDTHCAAGVVISPHYDSMIAKLIVWDTTREGARRRMLRALREFRIEGVTTTIPFHIAVLETEEFASSAYHTRWVEQRTQKAEAA